MKKEYMTPRIHETEMDLELMQASKFDPNADTNVITPTDEEIDEFNSRNFSVWDEE